MQEKDVPSVPIEQLDRWAIIGRLTASLFHEINNPMQAIRGAISLSLEELDDPEELRDYLELSLKESDKVVRLIERVRRTYYSTEQATAVDLNHLLRECAALSRKYLAQQWVKLELRLIAGVLPVTAVFSELSLAFLCPIIQMADAISARGGGVLIIQSVASPAYAQVQITTSSTTMPPNGFMLNRCNHVIHNCQGMVNQNQNDGQVIVEIRLPLS